MNEAERFQSWDERTVADDLAARLSWNQPAEYKTAHPFPYTVVDNLITEPVAHHLASLFPPASWKAWRLHTNKNTLKRDCADLTVVPPDLAKVLRALNSEKVVRELRYLTGIHDLVADERLEGGGMHRIDKGGFLGIHRDFNLTPDKKMRRRVNVLLYLNACAGGDLELWEEENYRPSKRAVLVSPWPGRAVIFNTAGPAWHGHPRPLQTPTRLSLATYYYTAAEPDSDRHLTIYSEAGR